MDKEVSMNVLDRAGGVQIAEAQAEHEQRLADARAEYEQRLVEAQAEHEQQIREFHARTCELGHQSLENYYWYHTIDLGKGLVTPGDYDYRHLLPAFGFPDRMEGMRVMDVGSATGFFAFEFERRGANVVSVELPSLADWDMLTSDREEIPKQLMACHNASTLEEAYKRHLDGPFQFCRFVLGSRVRRTYSSVYDLTLDKLGGEKFDLVYAGDVLLHLFSPLKALDVLAGLCKGSLVTTIDVPFIGEAPGPLMGFMGHQSPDCRTWWQLSHTCVEHMLKRLGFRSVSVSGRYSGIIRRAWAQYTREVIWASKAGAAQH
jgi:tRNA (mo5U34)-methyltransferase